MDEAQRLGEGAVGVALLRGVWQCMPSLALWKWTRAANTAEKAETAERTETAGRAETAETAKKADEADVAEVGGEPAMDRWRNSEERKALLRGLANKDVSELGGMFYDPRTYKVEASRRDEVLLQVLCLEGQAECLQRSLGEAGRGQGHAYHACILYRIII